MDLASRDSRFRKGLGSTGPAGRGRGRGGAGRGRNQVRTLAGQFLSPDSLLLKRALCN